ncbi:MAG: toll/interleukin-1 receptor domain-containing protein [Lachnospiraceae bacterium]|nr:toll/interleukin-1 receptor domain-containing protein [Lachnospiraceae bacterium]
MGNGYKYDAFISYRHAELDKFVAENLHRKLESYKISKKVLSNGRTSRSKIERVFRDKDELPITNNLEDPIIKALSESEYLIVICTPRLKESIWCKKEIETFIEMHGRDKIFAVLAEGEPHESFPEEILYREEKVPHPDGTESTRLVPAEPLAADVRGKTKKEILKAMDVELLRLLAPMLGVDFDDLRQRHRERKFRRIITATVAAAVLCLGIGVASSIAAYHINKQKEQIEAQSIEIQAQAAEIEAQSETLATQNEQLLNNQAENLAEESLRYLEAGDRETAIELSLAALTDYDGIPMPYTPEAQYALTESIHLYDAASMIKPRYQVVMPAQIEEYILSPDKDLVLCRDTLGNVGIWGLETGELIKFFSNDVYNISPDQQSIDFHSNGKCVVYVTDDNQLVNYDIWDDEEVSRLQLDVGGSLSMQKSGIYTVIHDYSNIGILTAGGSDIENVGSLQPNEGYTFTGDVYMTEIDDWSKLCYVERRKEDIDDILSENKDMTDYCRLHIYDLFYGKEEAVISINFDGVNTIAFEDSYMYYAVSNYEMNSEDRLVKYDMVNNEVVWDVPVEAYVTEICLAEEDGDALLAVGSLEAFLIDKNTGEQRSRIDFSNTAISTRVMSENSFEIFLQNSDYGQYRMDSDSYIVYDNYFEKNYDTVVACDKTELGYIVQGLNDNKLTYYEVSMGEDITLYEREFNSEGIGSIADYDDDTAQTLNPAKANLVNTVLYSDDKKVVFISYTDKTVEIYNRINKTLLATMVGVEDELDVYYGVDDKGYTYVGGYSHGYILDKEYNVIARPEMLRGVDFDAKLLIVEVGNQYGSIPIYSLEQVISRGEVVLKKLEKSKY